MLTKMEIYPNWIHIKEADVGIALIPSWVKNPIGKQDQSLPLVPKCHHTQDLGFLTLSFTDRQRIVQYVLYFPVKILISSPIGCEFKRWQLLGFNLQIIRSEIIQKKIPYHKYILYKNCTPQMGEMATTCFAAVYCALKTRNPGPVADP